MNLLQKEVKGIRQDKSLVSENRGLEQLVEILKDPNDAWECIMLNVRIDKMDQVISIIQNE